MPRRRASKGGLTATWLLLFVCVALLVDHGAASHTRRKRARATADVVVGAGGDSHSRKASMTTRRVEQGHQRDTLLTSLDSPVDTSALLEVAAQRSSLRFTPGAPGIGGFGLDPSAPELSPEDLQHLLASQGESLQLSDDEPPQQQQQQRPSDPREQWQPAKVVTRKKSAQRRARRVRNRKQQATAVADNTVQPSTDQQQQQQQQQQLLQEQEQEQQQQQEAPREEEMPSLEPIEYLSRYRPDEPSDLQPPPGMEASQDLDADPHQHHWHTHVGASANATDTDFVIHEVTDPEAHPELQTPRVNPMRMGKDTRRGKGGNPNPRRIRRHMLPLLDKEEVILEMRRGRGVPQVAAEYASNPGGCTPLSHFGKLRYI